MATTSSRFQRESSAPSRVDRTAGATAPTRGSRLAARSLRGAGASLRPSAALLRPGAGKKALAKARPKDFGFKDQSGPRKLRSIVELLALRSQYKALADGLQKEEFEDVIGQGLGLSTGLEESPFMAPIAVQTNRPKFVNTSGKKGFSQLESTSTGQSSRESSPAPQQQDSEPAGDVKPLAKKSSGGGWVPMFRRKQQMSPEERISRKINDWLNKLTPTKFESIAEQLITYVQRTVATLAHLNLVVRLVFEKACEHHSLLKTFTQLVEALSKQCQVFEIDVVDEATGGDKTTQITFRKSLLNQCQIQFSKGEAKIPRGPLTPAAVGMFDDERLKEELHRRGLAALGDQDSLRGRLIQALEDEYEEKVAAEKRRRLGNIKFIGNLFLAQLLPPMIIGSCIKGLLSKARPTSTDIESLYALMITVGKKLDQGGTKNHVNGYMARIKAASQLPGLEIKYVFMLQRLAEIRRNGWELRVKEVEAKTIDQIHKEAAIAKGVDLSSIGQVNASSAAKYDISDGTDIAADSAGTFIAPVSEASPYMSAESLTAYRKGRYNRPQSPSPAEGSDNDQKKPSPKRKGGAFSAAKFGLLASSEKKTTQRKPSAPAPSRGGALPKTIKVAKAAPKKGAKKERAEDKVKREEELREKRDGFIKNFAGDFEAAIALWATLQYDSSSDLSKFVERTIDLCSEGEQTWATGTQLLCGLASNSIISSDAIAEGLLNMLEFNDLQSQDFPEWAEQFPKLIANLIASGAVDPAFLRDDKVCSDSKRDPTKKVAFFVSLFKALSTQKDAAYAQGLTSTLKINSLLGIEDFVSRIS